MKGFSLVELMVVFLIFSIILGSIFAVMTMGRKSWQTGNVQIEVQQEARKAMDSMVEELRQSTLGRITLGADTVTFQIPQSIDANGNISWSGNIVYSLGGLNGKQLLRTEGGANTVLANNVQSFNPAISGKEISITLVVEKKSVFQRTLTAALSSQVTLRN